MCKLTDPGMLHLATPDKYIVMTAIFCAETIVRKRKLQAQMLWRGAKS